LIDLLRSVDETAFFEWYLYPTDFLDLCWPRFFAVVALGWLKPAVTTRIRKPQAAPWNLQMGWHMRGLGVLFDDLAYSYTVDSSYDSGTLETTNFGFQKDASLRGKPLRVRFKPGQPDISFLLDSDQSESLRQ